MDENLRRDIILDNFSNPQNKETVTDSNYIYVNSNNESCIDNIDLWIKIEDDKITDVKFNGEACAISTASTSIMTTKLTGLTIEEAKQFVQNFSGMINEENYDRNLMEEALVFDEIYKQANRKTCALLSYNGILKALEKYENEKK